MSEFVEVNTAELTEQALDWATAIATGWVDIGASQSYPGCRTIKLPGADSHLWVGHRSIFLGVFEAGWFSPTTYWEQGGPLIDAHNIKLESYPKELGEGRASVRLVFTGKVCWQSGASVLIAACRAIVAAKLGEAVLVPAELLGVDR